MSYSNYEPDDRQHRFHTQPTAPYPQTAAPYTEPPGSYPEPGPSYPQSGPSYPQSGPQYAQPGASYPQSGPQYAQPGAPSPQSGPQYAQPAAPSPPPAYAPPQYPAPPTPQQRTQKDTATIVARFVVGFTGGVALIFALHIVFSLTNANQGNGFVQFVYALAKVFVLGFGDVFTPDDAKIGLVLNYGLAALVYLGIGKVVARALRQ